MYVNPSVVWFCVKTWLKPSTLVNMPKIYFLCNNLGFAQNFWCFSISVLTFLPALESSANMDREVRASLITRSSMYIYIYKTKHKGPRTLPGVLQTKLVSRLIIYYCNKLSVIYRFTSWWSTEGFFPFILSELPIILQDVNVRPCQMPLRSQDM